MLTNHFFKDLYDERWGDPHNPNAGDPPLPEHEDNAGGRSVLGWLAGLFPRRKRPSAWSFTIPCETSDTESEIRLRRRDGFEDPKFFALAKALSRNC